MLEREADRLRSEISLLESKVCVPRIYTCVLELYFGPSLTVVPLFAIFWSSSR